MDDINALDNFINSFRVASSGCWNHLLKVIKLDEVRTAQ
jgi:hypothetical protein